ncbi:deoxyguanosinetriphosphate triphosphohydrolase [Nocardioidaceae bacterium]|nr:deoxyguanosinetriphosphate triphosphohydrolase [Nocardioidaceae bacterium]
MGERWDHLYSEADRARRVAEPVKRVDAPERTPFERDRARVVHSAALRRLADKTQVLGPHRDFVRNRLTHSLEVAQVGRDVAHVLGCHPDLVETAALAHDLGHPPFGHNGEVVLAELAATCGGFEGNAQTLRLLTRLEAKSVDADGASAGLNLTRATLDACTKYPWTREAASPPTMRHADGSPRGVPKFGVYDDDLPVFAWLRDREPATRTCVEAQVMDLADDVAYSVHDVEDGVVAGGIDLTVLDAADARQAVWETVRDWYLPGAADDRLEDAWAALRAVGSWPEATYDGTRPALRSLKNLTSDLIGRFCGAVESATREAYGDRPLVRHDGDVVVPGATLTEIAVLKGVAAHYVMSAPERVATMERQRQLLAELHEAVSAGAPDTLLPDLREDFEAATDDAARGRVVLDHVASLTDGAAVHSHGRLTGRPTSRP